MKHTKKRMVTAMTSLVLTTLMLLSIAGCRSDPSSSGTASSSQSGQSPTSGVSPVQPVQDTNSPIDSLRAYMYPSGEVPVFSVEQQNYSQAMPLISYDVFDCEDILLNRLSAKATSMEELDKNNDGKTDWIQAKGDTFSWYLVDTNYDGLYDTCLYTEFNFGITTTDDFMVSWVDYDANGTMDEVQVSIVNPEHAGSNTYDIRYTYGDYSDINFDTGSANYTNKGRIQYIQAVTTSETSTILEGQKFRDMDGDGFIDWVQLERWYDTNNDGIRESLKTLYDRDADGVFEDEEVYDGTIFDNSLYY